MSYQVVEVLPTPKGNVTHSSTEWKGDSYVTRVDYSTGETEYYDEYGLTHIIVDGVVYFPAE